MLSLREMRYFITVADELNFTRAAARLNVAQPALTRAIKKLEAALGAHLLIRDTRNVCLTEFGNAFLVEARLALTQVSRAERLGREMALGRIGQIRIGYTAFVEYDLLAPILKRFRQTSPNVRIELNNLPSERQRAALLEGTVDSALILGPLSIPRISTCHIRDEPLAVVMPRGHRLGERETLTASDLRGEELIMGTENMWSMYRQGLFSEFYDCGVLPRISMEAPTPTAVLALVGAGIGLTIFPMTYSQHLVKQFQDNRWDLRPFITRKCKFTIVCAWSTDNKNPVLRSFLDSSGIARQPSKCKQPL